MSQNQGQSQNMPPEPDPDENDDFEELDESFPITRAANVEDLHWNIKRDLAFKRRMVNKILIDCKK